MSRQTETIKYLTQDELKRLLLVIKVKRDKAIFLLAYRHGLRASEIGLLRVDDVDFVRLRIRLHRLKGSLSGEHPLRADEARVLKAYIKSRKHNSPILFPSNRQVPISRRTLDALTKQYGERADLPEDKRHFHTLKHSVATHLLDAGADVRFVQDWLGHANIQNTIIYANLVSSTRDAQAQVLFTRLPAF